MGKIFRKNFCRNLTFVSACCNIYKVAVAISVFDAVPQNFVCSAYRVTGLLNFSIIVRWTAIRGGCEGTRQEFVEIQFIFRYLQEK